MNGNTVDKQVRFIIQLGKTVFDDDKIIAEEIVGALADYGFKDAQVLGVVQLPGEEVRTAIGEPLPRVDPGE